MDRLSLRCIDDLKTWQHNYRRGRVDAIASSIVEFGFNHVLRVWRDDVVIAGNHTLLALRKLRDTGAPPPTNIVVVDGGWCVPCLDVSHLTPNQATAFAVADNRLHDIGEDDNQILAELLKSLQTEMDLIYAAGFTDAEFSNLLSAVSASLEPPTSVTEHWRDMPEFVASDELYHAIRVMFKTRDDMLAFAELCGYGQITEKTKSVWYPDDRVDKTEWANVGYAQKAQQ